MKKIIFAATLTLLAGFSVFAQTINLEQARALALANSRSLARFEMSIRTSILDERSQLYLMLPQISAGYSVSTYFMQDWEFVNPIDTLRAGANFSITQVIFQGGRSFIQKAITAIATESVRKDALAEFFNVLDAVDNAYYEVLKAAATLEAEEASLQAAEVGLSIAEIRHASGMINQGEFLRALAEKETRENSRNQARRNLTMRMNQFRTLTGITGSFELEPVDFSAYENVIRHLASISDEDAYLLLDEFWKLAADANPSLARAALNTQRAELNLTNTRRDFSPTITAELFSGSLTFLPSYGTTSRSGLSITGTIPVDFWVMRDRIKRSKINRDLALMDFSNAEDSLEQTLQETLFNLFSHAGSVLSARRSLEHTERHFEFVMERYRLLQSSIAELLEANTLLINSRNNSTRANYSFLQSLSRLRSLCAIDDAEKLLEILLQ